MKFCSHLAIFCICFMCFAGRMRGQDHNIKTKRIEIDFGLAKTFHYNAPVNLISCYEGCFATKQKALPAINGDISYFISLNEKNEINVGLGGAQYRYYEMGLAYSPDPNPSEYEETNTYTYIDFFVGHRLTLAAGKKIRPFLENNLIMEVLPGDWYVIKPVNFAWKIKSGLNIPISTKFTVNMCCYYKTAVLRFDFKDFDSHYFPYAFGIQMGVGTL
ncbi:MAG: hypothetical protein ABJC12_02150 [Saprospiraceae bacterium]